MTPSTAQPSFEIYLERGAEWLGAHWKWVALFIALVIAGSIAYFSYRYSEERAFNRLAQNFYTTVLAKETLRGEARLAALAELKATYAQAKGHYWLAVEEILTLVEMKQWGRAEAQSLKLAETVSDADLKALALFAAAHSAENQGALDRAIALFDRIDASSKSYALLAQAEKGRVLIQSGKHDEGRKVLEQVLKSTAPLQSESLQLWVQDLLIWSDLYGIQQTGS